MAESRARLRALLLLPDTGEAEASPFPRSVITRLALSLLPTIPRLIAMLARRRRHQSPWPLLAQSVIQAFGARLR